MKRHEYRTSLRWTGNKGTGTSAYDAYGREHDVSTAGKASTLECSSDTQFRGNAERYNPEELLVASLSGCHMLSYLHLCAVAGVVVTAYEDHATGEMDQDADSAHFTSVTLRPRVTISAQSDAAAALHLHEEAGRLCFIAKSVRFPVTHEPVVETHDTV